MKKVNVTHGIIAAIFLAMTISPTGAMYTEYDTAQDFLDAFGGTCLSARVGETVYPIENQKLVGYTGDYSAQEGINWQCNSIARGVMTTKAITSQSVQGVITSITLGKDGKQIVVEDGEGKSYSTAISIVSDTIENGEFTELVVGANVIVYYSEIAGDILIGDMIRIDTPVPILYGQADDVEGITGHDIGEKDQLLYTSILPVISPDYQVKVSKTLTRIITLSDKYSQKQKDSFAQKIQILIESKSKILQSKTSLSVSEEQILYALQLLRIELKMIFES